jgi:hypothetical protein
MKNQVKTNLAIRFSLALGFALTAWAPVYAQSPQPAAGKAMTEANMMEHCQEMKDQKQKMKEDTKAQDAQLTEQLADMNRAPKDKKVGLMASTLTGMVQQRITMDARKAKMEDEMMQHMMQHMQIGKESMAQCPMMKGMKDMKGMDESSAATHKDHQQEQK